jgi:hypothetical protein
MVQNQPNPDTPVQERRWLDRLRAAWDGLREHPEDGARAVALDSVARERPQEAGYRVDTFAADAEHRRRAAPAESQDEPAERTVPPERARADTTAETDRFDDESGQ